MDISVGAHAGPNPEVNIDNLLQMIKSAGLGKAATKEKDNDGAGSETEDGNIFLQVLQQKLAGLLQSDQSGSSAELTADRDLSAVIEKLLEGDQNAAGEILSGFALLAMAGPMEGFVTGNNELSEESFSGLVAAKGISDILKEGVTSDADQTKQALAEKEKGIFVSRTMELPGDKSAVQPGVVPELNDREKSIEAALQSQTPSLKDIQESALSGYAEAERKALTEEQAKAPVLKSVQDNSQRQANNVERQGLPEGHMKASSSIPENQVNALTGYADVQKKASAEGKDKTPQPKNMEGISIAEKASGENQSIKTSLSAAGVVQENKSHLNISNGRTIEDENLSTQAMQDQAGQKMKQKMSIKQEIPLADEHQSPSLNDAQKNIAGKAAALTSEFAGVIDKVKTEFKSKTVSGEKNLENNSLNSSAMSGIGSTKTAASDVSPAQIISRVASEFNESLASEGGRVKITLAPPSLGTLEMDVSVQNSKVRIMLTADNQDVQKMLSGNLDALKGSLQSQGLTIERCDVMMQDRREQYSQGFNQQPFSQEQSAQHHDDNGEPYNANDQTVTPLILKSRNQMTGRLGNISIFA
jgi:flagellar hook-length control protein FliK